MRKPPSPDAETARVATNLFKLFNFELFMKENKTVMASGVQTWAIAREETNCLAVPLLYDMGAPCGCFV
jgi:hypothetical protein